jgi:hypothetical protein
LLFYLLPRSDSVLSSSFCCSLQSYWAHLATLLTVLNRCVFPALARRVSVPPWRSPARWALVGQPSSASFAARRMPLWVRGCGRWGWGSQRWPKGGGRAHTAGEEMARSVVCVRGVGVRSGSAARPPACTVAVVLTDEKRLPRIARTNRDGTHNSTGTQENNGGTEGINPPALSCQLGSVRCWSSPRTPRRMHSCAVPALAPPARCRRALLPLHTGRNNC